MRISTLIVAAVLAGSAGLPASARAASPGPPADTSRVALGTGATRTEAFVAWPPGTGPAAGLVLVHESSGLDLGIRDMARRFARQGYVTIVPDLYHGRAVESPEQAREMAATLDARQASVDLAAAAAWLRNEKRSSKARLGVVGLNSGATIARTFTSGRPDVAALVIFYGDPGGMDEIRTLNTPLQCHFGEKDEGIDPARVSALEVGLSQAGKAHEVFIYSGAGHEFMNEASPGYHADAARQAWARTLSFLQKNLKAKP